MDPPTFDLSSSHQMPQSLPVSALQGMLDADVSYDWIPDNPTVDLDFLNNFYFCSSEPSNLERLQWAGLDSAATSNIGRQSESALQTPEIPNEAVQSPQTGILMDFAQLQSLSNVSQWLDGAYRPPVPCTHCRRHRLQCLILRTTDANPNPVTSCSSCVALFRECSLAKGTKRLPSGFETFSPVLGHLHGLPEQTEDSVSFIPNCYCSSLTIRTRKIISLHLWSEQKTAKNPSSSSEKAPGCSANGSLEIRSIHTQPRIKKLSFAKKRASRKGVSQPGLQMLVDDRSKRFKRRMSQHPLVSGPGHHSSLVQ